ncbi:MAG: site-specific integrase [Faecousia sp.]
MEPYAKNLPITELIAQLDAYMVELGYTPSTLRHHRQAWNALKNLALAEGATYFTKELGFKLLREHYHVDPYDSKLSEYKSVVRRSVMLLLEFQISGTIAKRIPKSEYIFPEGFRIAGEAYLSMLQSEGHIKESTLRNHRHRLVAAALFFENHGVTGIEFVNTEIINLYLKTLAGCSQSYLSGVLRTLKRFFEFSSKRGYLLASFTFPSVSVYKDRKVPEYYLPEEISGILSAIDRGNPLGKRNYAMILLAARYGLRIGDIRTLKLTDVDFSTNQIHIIQQKTSKPLTLDLLPDVGWALIDYLKFGRPKVSAAEIFLRHVHPYGPLGDSDNMGYVIRQYAVAAGIRKNAEKAHHGFHMLRYSLASDLIQQGISLTTISGILGHSQLSVTSRYTQLDIPQLMDCALEVPV